MDIEDPILPVSKVEYIYALIAYFDGVEIPQQWQKPVKVLKYILTLGVCALAAETLWYNFGGASTENVQSEINTSYDANYNQSHYY